MLQTVNGGTMFVDFPVLAEGHSKLFKEQGELFEKCAEVGCQLNRLLSMTHLYSQEDMVD